MKKRSLKLLFQDYQLEFFATVGILITAGIYIIHLGSMPSHFSVSELHTYRSNQYLHNILHNPLNAPYNLIDYAMLHIPGHTTAVARLTSVGFALLAVFLFFSIMLRWHGKRTAWMATTLFATSGWILHIGRLGTPTIVWLIIPLTLILMGSWLAKTNRHGTAIMVVATILGLMLFVPAALWFVIAFMLLTSRELAKQFREAAAWQRFVAILLLLLFVAAIAFSIYRSHDLLRQWIGLPQMLPSYLSMAKVWVSSLVAYPFFRGPAAPEIWLGHTPILDVFTTTMFLIGAYFYATHFRNLRTRILTVSVIIGSVLTALNGPTAMSFIIPVAYLIAATGITYLLHQWLTVFPRNPFARIAGITIITIAILSAVAFHMISYFVAWQHNPQAVATFQRKS